MIKNGPNLVIRPYEPDEWPIMSHWFYSGDYPEFFRDQSTLMNIAQLQSFVGGQTSYGFLIRLGKEFKGHPIGTVIGFINLYDIRWVPSTLKLGILIEKEFQGQQFCMEAIWLICDYVFNQMRFRKMIIEFLKSNQRIESILKFGGFKKEATLKDEAYMNGKYVDVVRYSIFDKQAKLKITEFGGILCQIRQ